MDDINSLTHSKWRCKYHIVFAPKYRRQDIYSQLWTDCLCFRLHYKENLMRELHLQITNLTLVDWQVMRRYKSSP
ncbi:hypothetical protein SAMN05192585_11745 [Acetanaerobacterium elongatum]|uniref:Transposase IS200 like n=1 Tax=Acetanaerobacterium elongatum TaxID=258515 RepID=A0A1H0AVJ3_9FIRM|nr:hypothetical protein SAMN05192585_11745 [Acetanaerobacterium elongatum]